ncbi:class I SAM-dependent methyltransferase [Candidatus Dojkabacteria bacterium]|nr:class I SAM-dependent methyltransferase [Candidatus Dojkabacteria bacterium]
MNSKDNLQNDVLNYWQNLATPCDKAYGELGDYLHRFVINPAIEKALGDINGKSILDLGSGIGTVARMLSSKGADIVALDFSSRMLALSRSRNKHIQHIQADLTNPLPFPEENFDSVVEVMVLQAIWDDQLKSSLNEVKRVLKKGGNCTIIVPNSARAEQFRGLANYNPELYLTAQYLMHEWRDLGINGNNQRIATPFILRPSQFYIQAFLEKGFILQEFIEPSLIDEAWQHLDEVHNTHTFNSLKERPSFVLLKWLKL